ncbi:MAG: radical SAM family heme chaperone HemW [Candidatus Saganbacteria bacterium]|nr:radical SAM family heme chaperone HemW [Candidatus Saganbacteria bacterium]
MTLEPATERRGSNEPRNRGVQPQVPSLYIHIPFCKRKCNYCDFISYAGKENFIDRYVEALCQEIKSLTPCPPSPPTGRQVPEGEGELRTVYFGGGTPTLLEPHHFDKIISSINSAFGIQNLEFSVEANPGTADQAKLKALKELGINRLSIGVQSFNDENLKTLGRIHDAATARQFYEDARAAGFTNINLDLIFALPGQTVAQWKEDLWAAVALGPEHISAYNLQIEEGTPFYKWFSEPATERRGSSSAIREETAKPCLPAGRFIRRFPSGIQLPSEDDELAMYEFTIETLWLSGYKHYEVSNFCRPGLECRHNLAYWQNRNYIGIGAAAHSHINGQRWANPSTIEDYLSTDYGLQATDAPGPDQRETIFMGLRLLDGLHHDNFRGFEKEVNELVRSGLLIKNGEKIKLTRKGLYLANEVFEQFV